ncbi:hypothetical protein ATKI12_0925 [Kitasatospora sp. Ki12]
MSRHGRGPGDCSGTSNPAVEHAVELAAKNSLRGVPGAQ